MFDQGKKNPEENLPKTEKSKQEPRCPKCGSNDILPAGFGNLSQCQKCGTCF